MKFLVTGANGFIGSNLVDKLIENNHEVRALILEGTNESNLDESKDKIEKVYGDITDYDKIRPYLEGIDVIIHLAARVDDWGPEKLFMKVSFEGAKNVLDAAIDAGVKRFIYISSLTVHGFEGFQKGDENAPYLPYNPYAKAKVAMEKSINNDYKEKNIETVIIRPGYLIFGPRDRNLSIKTYDRITRKKSFPCVKGGKPITSYSYVENLVDGLILVSTHPKAAGETYIINDGHLLTFKEWMEYVFKSCDIKLKMPSIPYKIAIGGVALLEGIYKLFRRKKGPILTRFRVKSAAADLGFVNHKIVNDLGYKPKIGIEEACRRTYEWFMKEKERSQN